MISFLKKNYRLLVVLGVLGIASLYSGYALGLSGRESAGDVQKRAEVAGYKKGYIKGKREGYKKGLKESKRRAYRESFALNYKERYLEEFKKAGIEKPKEIYLP